MYFTRYVIIHFSKRGYVRWSFYFNATLRNEHYFKKISMSLLGFVGVKKPRLLFQECEAQSTRLVKSDGSESLRRQ